MQMKLPMLTLYEGPKLVSQEVIGDCKSYRDAVRMCYQLRTRKHATNGVFAGEIGCHASHFGDYVTSHERKVKRDLPAEYIPEFEVSMGNRLITQWLNSQAHLTILEQFLEARAA